MAAMSDRVALITGAGGGIGAAIGRQLHAAGAAVALLDVDGGRTAPLADELARDGAEATAVEVDVREPASVERALDFVEASLGPVTDVVTAAGVIHKAPFLELEHADWQRTIEINLTGTWLMVQRAARRMVSSGYGNAFVALSSVAGRGPRATAADYAASKAGVISVVRSAAVALAAHGIRVNAVCPGVVDSPMTDAIHAQTSRELGITAEESVARMVAGIPLGRIETADEVADAVTWLLSDHAGYVTGQAINVCGGLEFD